MATEDITFDDKALQQAFTRYIDYSKRSVPYILEKQMSQLAIGAKGVKGLYQEAMSTRPATVAAIKALPEATGHRIKRGKGRTEAQEIKARVAKAGYYQASGWIIPGLPETNKRGVKVTTVRGELVGRANGSNATITIRNNSPQAGEFGKRTGYVQRAVNNRARDMVKYVEKKLASDAKEFSAQVATFSKSIPQQLDELMGKAGY